MRSAKRASEPAATSRRGRTIRARVFEDGTKAELPGDSPDVASGSSSGEEGTGPPRAKRRHAALGRRRSPAATLLDAGLGDDAGLAVLETKAGTERLWETRAPGEAEAGAPWPGGRVTTEGPVSKKESLAVGTGPGPGALPAGFDVRFPPPATAEARTPEAGGPAQPPSPHGGPTSGGGIFKHAAVEVLRASQRLMTCGDIAQEALSLGLVRRSGKTPKATMASALYTDIRKPNSVFVRPAEGLFGLREWAEAALHVPVAPDVTRAGEGAEGIPAARAASEADPGGRGSGEDGPAPTGRHVGGEGSDAKAGVAKGDAGEDAVAADGGDGSADLGDTGGSGGELSGFSPGATGVRPESALEARDGGVSSPRPPPESSAPSSHSEGSPVAPAAVAIFTAAAAPRALGPEREASPAAKAPRGTMHVVGAASEDDSADEGSTMPGQGLSARLSSGSAQRAAALSLVYSSASLLEGSGVVAATPSRRPPVFAAPSELARQPMDPTPTPGRGGSGAPRLAGRDHDRHAAVAPDSRELEAFEAAAGLMDLLSAAEELGRGGAGVGTPRAPDRTVSPPRAPGATPRAPFLPSLRGSPLVGLSPPDTVGGVRGAKARYHSWRHMARGGGGAGEPTTSAGGVWGSEAGAQATPEGASRPRRSSRPRSRRHLWDDGDGVGAPRQGGGDSRRATADESDASRASSRFGARAAEPGAVEGGPAPGTGRAWPGVAPSPGASSWRRGHVQASLDEERQREDLWIRALQDEGGSEYIVGGGGKGASREREAAEEARPHSGVPGPPPPPRASPPAPAARVVLDAESEVMALERALPQAHPVVGRAYLSLARLYLATGAGGGPLVGAALLRAAESMRTAHLAAGRVPGDDLERSWRLVAAVAERAAAEGAKGEAAGAAVPGTGPAGRVAEDGSRSAAEVWVAEPAAEPKAGRAGEGASGPGADAPPADDPPAPPADEEGARAPRGATDAEPAASGRGRGVVGPAEGDASPGAPGGESRPRAPLSPHGVGDDPRAGASLETQMTPALPPSSSTAPPVAPLAIQAQGSMANDTPLQHLARINRPESPSPSNSATPPSPLPGAGASEDITATLQPGPVEIILPAGSLKA